MHDVDWTTPAIVLAAGLLMGLFIALLQRSSSKRGQAPAADLRREDLLREKERLLRAIRELQDTGLARGDTASAQELADLERKAAEVLRDLALLAEGAESPAEEPEFLSEGTPPAAAEAGTRTGLSAEHRGMLKGGVVVLFAAVLVFALLRGSTERTENMGMTGAAPVVSELARTAPMPQAGEPGGAVPGVPPALQPKPSRRVDSARARVGANSKDPVAWAELGYSLIDAEGWIDAYQVSQQLQELAPSDADGYVIEAMVRVPMGQPSIAEDLLGRALEREPDHVMALTSRGMLRFSQSNREAAKADWLRARAIAGPGHGHDELLAMADGAPSPGSHPGEDHGRTLPPGHPPTGSADAKGSTDPKALSGTVTLGAGVSPPVGGVVFVFARNPGQAQGPPVAVRRFDSPQFPLSFTLGPGDRMIQGVPFPDTLDLSVRWDRDGNAMTKEAGDLRATASSVAAGSKGLELSLAPAAP